jgi:hypothetical protein
MGKAQSIAFYPITDSSSTAHLPVFFCIFAPRHDTDIAKANGERWQSCTFVWTSNAARIFDLDGDITYLSAFGHSLGAELGRFETVASD